MPNVRQSVAGSFLVVCKASEFCRFRVVKIITTRNTLGLARHLQQQPHSVLQQTSYFDAQILNWIWNFSFQPSVQQYFTECGLGGNCFIIDSTVHSTVHSTGTLYHLHCLPLERVTCDYLSQGTITNIVHISSMKGCNGPEYSL